MKNLFLLSVLALSSTAAFAGTVDMSCKQAQNYYWKHGRINVRANGKDIVPIYGLHRSCPAFYYDSEPYSVQATDSRHCLLGYRCIYNSDHD